MERLISAGFSFVERERSSQIAAPAGKALKRVSFVAVRESPPSKSSGSEETQIHMLGSSVLVRLACTRLVRFQQLSQRHCLPQQYPHWELTSETLREAQVSVGMRQGACMQGVALLGRCIASSFMGLQLRI